MARSTPRPFRVLVTAAGDTPVWSLAQQIEDERLIVTSCATQEEARHSLIAGLPDLGILDGSLPGASVLRIYTALRPESASDHIPVLFTNHALDVPAVTDGVPDIYLAGGADLEAVRSAVYQSLGLPFPEPIVTSIDPPAATVLDARLPEAELAAVYRSIREQEGGADRPVLFIHDSKCPPGTIVRNGADMYLGEGASVEQALEALYERVFARRSDLPSAPAQAEPNVRAARRPSIVARNPLAGRILRALPIAAMIVIGGFAGVMTAKAFDTRSWPLAHPVVVSAATPPTTNAPTIEPTGSPLEALATRAALSRGSPRVSRATPESADCVLMPAFECLSKQIGERTSVGVPISPTIRDAQQPTPKGLFALRSKENWVAFTDVYRTWVTGAKGVPQQRFTTERFPWESASVDVDRAAIAVLDGRLSIAG